MASHSLDSLVIRDIVKAGLSLLEARKLLDRVTCPPAASKASPSATWSWISGEVLSPEHPFELHRLLFSAVYSGWDKHRGPPSIWTPNE